jgi:hypothetical protein
MSVQKCTPDWEASEPWVVYAQQYGCPKGEVLITALPNGQPAPNGNDGCAWPGPGECLITEPTCDPQYAIPPSTSPSPTQGQTQAQSTSGPAQAVEGPGSYDHSTDAGFCSSHACIANFPNGQGYIVQCADGEWSHSGGLSGACSDHGGES